MSLALALSSLANNVKNVFIQFPSERKVDSPWSTLPPEIITIILEMVGEPIRTSLVDRQCRDLSKKYVYSFLLQSHTHYKLSYPKSLKKCKALYKSLMDDAKEAGMNMEKVRKFCQKYDPCSSRFLRPLFQAVNKRQKLQSVQAFCKKIFPHMHVPENEHDWTPPDCNQKELVLNCKMSYLTSKIELFTRVNYLSIGGCGLLELPQEFKKLIRLQTLVIWGNCLELDNVRDICKSLPCLQLVVVYEYELALRAMFENEFPYH